MLQTRFYKANHFEEIFEKLFGLAAKYLIKSAALDSFHPIWQRNQTDLYLLDLPQLAAFHFPRGHPDGEFLSTGSASTQKFKVTKNMRHNHVLSLQKTAIETVLAFHIEMYQECPYYIEFAAWLLGSSHLQHDLLLAAASGLKPLANQLPSAWSEACIFLSIHYLELQASLSITPAGTTVLPDPLALSPWQLKSQQT